MTGLLTGLTLAAPAGVNAYIPLLTIAVAQAAGWVQLRAPFNLLGTWWAIAIIAVLLLVEIVADKVPAVDHANDVVQTFVRPAAGGIVALAASGQAHVSPVGIVIAGILIAGSVHTVKAATRPVVNVTTAGTGAPVVSTVEDVGAFIASVLAIVAPLLAAIAIVAVIVLAIVAVKRFRASRAARKPPGPAASGS